MKWRNLVTATLNAFSYFRRRERRETYFRIKAEEEQQRRDEELKKAREEKERLEREQREKEEQEYLERKAQWDRQAEMQRG